MNTVWFLAVGLGLGGAAVLLLVRDRFVLHTLVRWVVPYTFYGVSALMLATEALLPALGSARARESRAVAPVDSRADIADAALEMLALGLAPGITLAAIAPQQGPVDVPRHTLAPPGVLSCGFWDLERNQALSRATVFGLSLLRASWGLAVYATSGTPAAEVALLAFFALASVLTGVAVIRPEWVLGSRLLCRPRSSPLKHSRRDVGKARGPRVVPAPARGEADRSAKFGSRSLPREGELPDETTGATHVCVCACTQCACTQCACTRGRRASTKHLETPEDPEITPSTVPPPPARSTKKIRMRCAKRAKAAVVVLVAAFVGLLTGPIRHTVGVMFPPTLALTTALILLSVRVMDRLSVPLRCERIQQAFLAGKTGHSGRGLQLTIHNRAARGPVLSEPPARTTDGTEGHADQGEEPNRHSLATLGRSDTPSPSVPRKSSRGRVATKHEALCPISSGEDSAGSSNPAKSLGTDCPLLTQSRHESLHEGFSIVPRADHEAPRSPTFATFSSPPFPPAAGPEDRGQCPAEISPAHLCKGAMGSFSNSGTSPENVGHGPGGSVQTGATPGDPMSPGTVAPDRGTHVSRVEIVAPP